VELLNLQGHLFIVLGQQRCEFVDYGIRGHSIMGRHVVHLLAFPLNSTEFLIEWSASCSEPLSVEWVASIKLRVVLPRGGTIPNFFVRVSRAIVPVLW
jgi:hypothetical protein